MANKYKSYNPGNLIVFEEGKRNKYPTKRSMHGYLKWTLLATPLGWPVPRWAQGQCTWVPWPLPPLFPRAVSASTAKSSLLRWIKSSLWFWIQIRAALETSRFLLSDNSRTLDQSTTGEHPSHIGWINPRLLKVLSISVSDSTDIILKLLWSLAGSLFRVYIHLSQWLFNRIFMWNFSSWIKWV